MGIFFPLTVKFDRQPKSLVSPGYDYAGMIR
jgi:hypothetical protein